MRERLLEAFPKPIYLFSFEGEAPQMRGFFISGMKYMFSIIALLLMPIAANASEDISIYPQKLYQGRTFTVYYKADMPVKQASGKLFGQDFPFYGDGLEYRGIIGISATAKTGSHALIVTVTCESGEEYKVQKSIKIYPSKFHAEKLFFVASKKGKATPVNIRSDQDQLNDVITRESPAQFWSGKFLMPVNGKITSAYGSYRLYNGKRLGDHRGTDIGGNPAGTLIKAANSGIVVFAKLLPAFGSVVVLDHGQGVHSIYMHMSKRLVELGEMVERGQFIGRVGSTGISTGPHLHFGLSVHGVRVDAMEWVRRNVTEEL